MDLAALRIFQAVAEAGGITRAAARLHRVQSNVTTRVKQLESELGIALFHRHKRRLTLSGEGKLLLAYARQMLRLSSEAEAAMRNGAPRGLLRIGALESTAATRLPPVLSAYHLAYPDVRLELVTGTSGALVRRVLAGEIEAALVAQPYPGDGLESQPVFVEELVLVAPKGFGPVRSARDLGHTPVLAFTTGCSYRRRLEAWLGASGIAPERVMEYGSYHAIVACVAAGSGVAVVPRSVVEALRAHKQLELHRLPKNVAIARTCLVWRQSHKSVALDALRTALSASPTARPPTPAAASPASRSASRPRPAARRAPRSSAPASSR
jgi:DNA-binding transcriptional LysR family regulator